MLCFNFLLVSKKLDDIFNLVISDAILLNALNRFVAKRTLMFLIVNFLQAFKAECVSTLRNCGFFKSADADWAVKRI
jgi:uncharacterized membrane protein